MSRQVFGDSINQIFNERYINVMKVINMALMRWLCCMRLRHNSRVYWISMSCCRRIMLSAAYRLPALLIEMLSSIEFIPQLCIIHSISPSWTRESCSALFHLVLDWVILSWKCDDICWSVCLFIPLNLGLGGRNCLQHVQLQLKIQNWNNFTC